MTRRSSRTLFVNNTRHQAIKRIALRRRLALAALAAATVIAVGLAARDAAAEDGHMGHDHSMHQGHDMGKDHAAHMKALPAAVTRSVARYDLPDLELLGSDGKPRSLAKVLAADEPVLVNFIFTTCTTVCPISSGTFARVQSLLAKDGQKFRLVSITIDPDQDTPARLRDYATKYGAGEQWQFLTGQTERIVETQRAFNAYRGNKMNHLPVTLMRASRDAPWIRYDGFVTPETLVAEYRTMVAPGKLVMK